MLTRDFNGRAPPNLDCPQPERLRNQATVLAAMMKGADDERITVEIFDVPAYSAIARFQRKSPRRAP